MDVTLKMLQDLVNVSVQAGDIILPYYRGGKSMETDLKDDKSPVTIADQEAETFILSRLSSLFPDIPIVAEEKAASGDIPNFQSGDSFFLVDPLDGTKEFINKRDEFTVNIALIQNENPVAGVVYVPALDDVYAGIDGKGALYLESRNISLKNAKKISVTSSAPKIAVASRSHMSDETQNFLDENDIQDYIAAGSSLKFCMVASGKADIYPRFGRTMEWDTAAGDAVVRASGGMTETVDGEQLRYGKKDHETDSDFANPYFIVRNQR